MLPPTGWPHKQVAYKVPDNYLVWVYSIDNFLYNVKFSVAIVSHVNSTIEEDFLRSCKFEFRCKVWTSGPTRLQRVKKKSGKKFLQVRELSWNFTLKVHFCYGNDCLCFASLSIHSHHTFSKCMYDAGCHGPQGKQGI